MRRSVAPWPALVLAALILLIAATPVVAQPKPPNVAFLEGTEVFRRILFDRGFKPLSTFDELAGDPQHSMLVVFGDGQPLTGVPGGLTRFVRDGGALFLATDRALPGGAQLALVQTAGVSIAGRSVICKNKDFCYRGVGVCPFLKPVDGANPNLFRTLTTNGNSLSNVASNAPSYLEHIAFFPRANDLALLPEGSVLEATGTPLPNDRLFAVGGNRGDGRVLVLADHSIFINEMMLPEDNGNVEFTYNCLEWLRGDAKEGRNHVLFFEENGRINSSFEVPLREMPDELLKRLIEYLGQHPDEAAKLAANIAARYPKETAKLARDAADAADKASQKIAPEVEEKVREVDERDGVNNGLLRIFGSPEGLLRGLAVWLAVLIVLYGCYRIGWKARRRTDLDGPLLATALHRLAPAGTVAEQRRRDLVRGDNLWEPARDLARNSLAAFGQTTAELPRVVAEGGWLRRRTMIGRVRRLWRLAYGPPARISLKEWQRLLREVQELKTALASGTVRIQG